MSTRSSSYLMFCGCQTLICQEWLPPAHPPASSLVSGDPERRIPAKGPTLLVLLPLEGSRHNPASPTARIGWPKTNNSFKSRCHFLAFESSTSDGRLMGKNPLYSPSHLLAPRTIAFSDPRSHPSSTIY